MKHILENWKAIQEIEDSVREKTGDPDAGFNKDIFWLGDFRKLALPCKYRKKKGETFTQKTFDMMVIAKYCPFTGKPLYEKGSV